MCNSSKNEDKMKGKTVKKDTPETTVDVAKIAKKAFNDRYRNHALSICIEQLNELYSEEYTAAILNTVFHVEKCTDREYGKYMKSDEFNPEDSRSRHDVRIEVINKGYHLFMAKCNQKGYEDLCEAIGEAVFEIEDLCFDSRERVLFADIGAIKDFDHGPTPRDVKYCAESIVIAHLVQMGTFCDLLEAMAPMIFWLDTAEAAIS